MAVKQYSFEQYVSYMGIHFEGIDVVEPGQLRGTDMWLESRVR